MKKTMMRVAVAAAFALPSIAQSTIFQFNASLSRGNEVLTTGAGRADPAGSPASGIATLFYDDKNTASLADDTYDFAMSVFGLTAPASAFHIHGAATTEENAPVRVPLDDPAQFIALNSGGTLLVGGNDRPAFTVPATPALPADPVAGGGRPNAGHPEMSFLAMLQGHLAYVNVHTPTFPAGEIRGQLLQVAVVPEPETYALMLAGLGLVGWVAARRRKVGV